MNKFIILGLYGVIVGVVFEYVLNKRSKNALHIAQLEGYDTDHYNKWVSENKERAFGSKKTVQAVKKPLVMTDRAKRLYYANKAISWAIWIIPTLLIALAGLKTIPALSIGLILAAASAYLQPYVMGLSVAVMKPFEDKINQGFYDQAQQKVKKREDLRVVGITGSFGKTSTKFIVGTILSEKFNVLNTPESYNTPMGLSKVINNQLKPEHEVFVAEMGAKVTGEIKELTDLVQPSISVITSIGPVHIETFKNIDNIMKTKYEIIEGLPTDGIAVFNYDNEHIKKLADKTFKEKLLYGFNDKETLDMYAEDISVSEYGSTFTLVFKDGTRASATTKLLGKHNIYNLLAGACVAKAMGMTLEEITRGIAKVEPIEHRLNLIHSPNGVIIIDDAFNSNPIGTKAALDVLGAFKEGKKIIVTPGMIELGELEEAANREFGVNIGKVCDHAILIGEKRTKPIYEGLISTNFNEDNIHVVNSLQQATEIIGALAKSKDVVLFENDLPDNYSE